MYVDAYLLAQGGHSNQSIAKTLGVQRETFQAWVSDKPTLKRALARARFSAKQSATKTFNEYIYERLEPKYQRILDQINEWEDETNGVKKIRALMENQGKRARQHMMLHALVACSFNISKACSKVCIGRTTFERWCNEDPEFSELIDEMDWHKGNFFEGALVDLVRKGETAAVLFANKTFNKSRGYGEKIEIEHSGTINHQMIDIASLDLSLETRKSILDAYRKSLSPDEPTTTDDEEVTDDEDETTSDEE